MSEEETPLTRMLAGMPRSGTEGMTRRLNTHPDIAAFGETLFWGRGYEAPNADGFYDRFALERIARRLADHGLVSSSGGGPGSLRALRREDLLDLLVNAFSGFERLTPGRAFQVICREVARVEGKSIGVEKTTHHVNWLGRIFPELPDARMVISMREPYGFMLSYKHLALRAERQGYSPPGSYHPAWPPIVWRKIVRAARAAAIEYPLNVHLVWLHDVSRDPDREYQKIMAFLGVRDVPLGADNPHQNTSFPDGKRPELAPDDIAWMNLINGPLMEREGFERRSSGASAWAAAKSGAQVPAWAFKSFRRVRALSAGSAVGYLRNWFR